MLALIDIEETTAGDNNVNVLNERTQLPSIQSEGLVSDEIDIQLIFNRQRLINRVKRRKNIQLEKSFIPTAKASSFASGDILQ